MFQLGVCGAADVKLREQGTGEAYQAQTKPEASCLIVAFHIPGFGQSGENPGDSALMQIDLLRYLRYPQRGLSDRERFKDAKAVKE
ncbi:hypothetical protein GCM10023346_05080 [Arthrobacter gyeryongensis]|uniref:Uncharacterized protein n=1 Tax=Arthrobacter gyeryongensis TaxID=1650592 RepID=A0ABP9S1M1_9MICC